MNTDQNIEYLQQRESPYENYQQSNSPHRLNSYEN